MITNIRIFFLFFISQIYISKVFLFDQIVLIEKQISFYYEGKLTANYGTTTDEVIMRLYNKVNMNQIKMAGLNSKSVSRSSNPKKLDIKFYSYSSYNINENIALKCFPWEDKWEIEITNNGYNKTKFIHHL